MRLSIESAIAQKMPAKEVLVIDDSTDNTPEIIREYADRGVKYLRGTAKGCCEARNQGIHTGTGDVIVILHADVILPPDFLIRITKHYREGADWVLVEAKVVNQDNAYARFIEMQHREEYEEDKIGYATEGFSFRREAALTVGGYTGEFPVKFCRDWTLGKKLSEAGYKKVFDRSIVVTHKAPDNFPEYWQVRKTRGRFNALLQRYLWGRSLKYLFMKFAAKDALMFLKFVLILPAAYRLARISSVSERPVRDFFALMPAYCLQEWSRVAGEWQGWRMALKRYRSGLDRDLKVY